MVNVIGCKGVEPIHLVVLQLQKLLDVSSKANTVGIVLVDKSKSPLLQSLVDSLIPKHVSELNVRQKRQPNAMKQHPAYVNKA